MRQSNEMRLMTLVSVLSAVFAGAMLAGCSSSDDGLHGGISPRYSALSMFYDGEYTVAAEDGLSIERDETGRIVCVQAFQPGTDDVDKLFAAPASFADIQHLFPLSEGNEVRLVNEGQNPPFEGLPDYQQCYEVYAQYYRGVPVYTGHTSAYYFQTPQGRRLAYAFINLADVKGIDTRPDVSENTARQVLATYLGESRDDSWPCSLYVVEFNVRSEGGQAVRDQRLAYHVTGPVAPSTDPDFCLTMNRYYAFVDAHTGELLLVSL